MKIEYIRIDGLRYESVAKYEKLLPVERQEKIKRYKFEADKLRSLIAGLLIRYAVGEGKLVYGEHGKPYIENSEIFFSVSHSGEIVAIACDSVELGLDVEELPDESRLKIADRFYHSNERRFVNEAEDKLRAFCDIWTRKEAYLKCTGKGISSDLTAFDTTAEPLNGRLKTFHLDGCSMSVCSDNKMTDEIEISKLELKTLLQK